MKKLLSLLLAVVLLLTSAFLLTACDEDKETVLSQDAVEDLLASTGENMEDLDDIEARASMTINITAPGTSMNIPMTLSLKLADFRSESPTMSMELAGSVMGETMDMSMYYKDGWSYVVEGDMRYKTQTDISFINLDPNSSELPELDDETKQMLEDLYNKVLESADAVTKKDNVTEIRFELTLEELLTALTALMEQLESADLGEIPGMESDTDLGEMGSIFEGMLAGVDTDSAIKFDLTVKDNYLTKLAIALDMGMVLEGQSMSYAIDLELELVNPGKSVTVELPEGYEDFEEMTDDLDDLSDIIPPLDVDTAQSTLEYAGYQVKVQTSDGVTTVRCTKGGDYITLYYFEQTADAIDTYDELVAEYGSQSEVLFGRFDTIVWFGTTAAVSVASDW